MGQAYIPASVVEKQYIGSTNVSSPYLMLVIDGIAYANGLRINYGGGYRNFFASFDANTGAIYVVCHTIAFGEDLPVYTLGSVEVIVIG